MMLFPKKGREGGGGGGACCHARFPGLAYNYRETATFSTVRKYKETSVLFHFKKIIYFSFKYLRTQTSTDVSICKLDHNSESKKKKTVTDTPSRKVGVA